MQDKWNIQKKYLEIHVAVTNINTKEIRALEVTFEKRIHNYKVIKKLVENDYSNNAKIRYCFGDDRVYGSNENFKYRNKKRIKAITKVKRNSIISLKN